jgi:hypothetical protein
MKITGIGLMIMAIVIAAFAVIAPAVNPASSETNSSVSSTTLGFAVAVGLCGLMIHRYGGRGYSVNAKPDVEPGTIQEAGEQTYTIRRPAWRTDRI